MSWELKIFESLHLQNSRAENCRVLGKYLEKEQMKVFGKMEEWKAVSFPLSKPTRKHPKKN
jgi:hypothetical protein